MEYVSLIKELNQFDILKFIALFVSATTLSACLAILMLSTNPTLICSSMVYTLFWNVCFHFIICEK